MEKNVYKLVPLKITIIINQIILVINVKIKIVKIVNKTYSYVKNVIPIIFIMKIQKFVKHIYWLSNNSEFIV